MRVASLFLAGLLAARGTVAQDCVNVALSAIPSCAQGCFLNGAPSVGCGGTDFACQCGKEAALYAAIEGCVFSSCPSASYQAVIDGASLVCECAAPTTAVSVSGYSGYSAISGSLVPRSFAAAAPATTTTATATTATAGAVTVSASTTASTPSATVVTVSGAVYGIRTEPGHAFAAVGLALFLTIAL
ncbi:hypothetical protein NKR23_g1169 [Pleurostoma richardsiae]|uniref:CFEM domain-containing protein n=1 Tax=Pleurostoma richardsiae TaxID=41990 RepID=A0AA38RZM2_9PEZI|nr:hypothetical protein NKR23_g1169 [Pleurostoma richardsiae]